MSGYLCAKFGVNRGHIHGEPPEMQNILNLLGHDSKRYTLRREKHTYELEIRTEVNKND